MISKEFKSVILKELNLDDFEINDETTADQVPGWDSLNHLNVILAIEEAFNVHLSSYDILKCNNIGNLYNLVQNKLEMKAQ